MGSGKTVDCHPRVEDDFMPARFSLLASGSSGNCAFLKADGFGLLIDAGLGPRFIASRLAAVGASWNDVHAVLLTHTHTDHWKDLTFAELRQRRIPFYCSPQHHVVLARYGGLLRPTRWPPASFARSSRGARSPSVRASPPGRSRCRTTRSRRSRTGSTARRGCSPRSGRSATRPTSGVARPDLIEAFADVTALAIEFNHCERMEQMSGRPAYPGPPRPRRTGPPVEPSGRRGRPGDRPGVRPRGR